MSIKNEEYHGLGEFPTNEVNEEAYERTEGPYRDIDNTGGSDISSAKGGHPGKSPGYVA